MRLHNRQIKAGFWTDGELLRWPLAKRMFYLGLIQIADDSGCLEDDPFAFKLLLFSSPEDQKITKTMLERWTCEITKVDKLLPYTIGNKQYFFLKNFHRHQKVDNAAPPECPLPSWIQWIPFPSNKRSGRYEVLTEDFPVRDSCLTTPFQPNLTKPNITQPPTGAPAREDGEVVVEETVLTEGDGAESVQVKEDGMMVPIRRAKRATLEYYTRHGKSSALSAACRDEMARRDADKPPPVSHPPPEIAPPPSEMTPEERREAMLAARRNLGLPTGEPSALGSLLPKGGAQ
jgi:hypothetical protein